ncbi:MAG: methyltransferase domain-containing protein [Alphaproteobacteria bacterium]|nr:methyltransferase domain-containing protein [Alphaproteobacteria bacterium]
MKLITNCRACGSTALTTAFSIAASYDASARAGRKKRAATRFQDARGDASSIDYVVCDATVDANACGLLQRASADGDLADGMRPPSGAYRSTRNYLRGVATEALELISGRDCAAIDIGCCDGTLLSYYPRWVERHGVDAASSTESVGAWATTIRTPFPSRETEEAFRGRTFDIVTAVSVLEDLAEPRQFLTSAKSLMSSDGVLVVETLYAPMLLTRASAEPVFERRAAVYSLAALERLFRDCGLKIFRGILTDKDGGSIRLFAAHEGFDDYDFDPWYDRLASLWDEENALALRLAAPYQAFEHRIAVARAAFEATMAEIAQGGEVAHLVGAGPAAAELYAWAGASRGMIEAAIAHFDPGPDDRLCPGGPPIISEAEAQALEPDCLIAPVAYKRDMLERWREPILRGARMAFAGPRPHVVTSANYAAEFGKTLAGGDGSGGPETLRSILSAVGGPQIVLDGGKVAAGS